MKQSRAPNIVTDIFFFLFASIQLLLFAYFNLKPHVNECSGPGFADGCMTGVFGLVGTILGLAYLTVLVIILVKSSASLYRNLRHRL